MTGPPALLALGSSPPRRSAAAATEAAIREHRGGVSRSVCAGDGKTACALLAPEQRAADAEAAGGCPALVEGLVETYLRGGLAEQLNEDEVDTLSEEGDRAVVRTTLGGAHEDVTLQRGDGVWLIDGGTNLVPTR